MGSGLPDENILTNCSSALTDGKSYLSLISPVLFRCVYGQEETERLQMRMRLKGVPIGIRVLSYKSYGMLFTVSNAYVSTTNHLAAPGC
jgi:hypothetical protein